MDIHHTGPIAVMRMVFTKTLYGDMRNHSLAYFFVASLMVTGCRYKELDGPEPIVNLVQHNERFSVNLPESHTKKENMLVFFSPHNGYLLILLFSKARATKNANTKLQNTVANIVMK